MKYQNMLLLLAILAVLAHEATCAEKNENENEPDENEPDENEGGHNGNNKKVMSDMAKNNLAMSSSTAWTSSSAVPTGSSAISASSAIPTGAVVSGFSSIASDASALQSSVVGAASSWVASVGNLPSATGIATPKVPLPSTSVARPYAGPSVINSSNRVEISLALASIGVLAFVLTLA